MLARSPFQGNYFPNRRAASSVLNLHVSELLPAACIQTVHICVDQDSHWESNLFTAEMVMCGIFAWPFLLYPRVGRMCGEVAKRTALLLIQVQLLL